MKTNYYLCVRQGKKWLAIAGTNSGGCQAGAETVFSYYGLKGETQWATIETQKNFAGRSADYRHVELSEREQAIHWFRQALKLSCYPTFERLVQTHPDAEQYRAELTAQAA